MDEESPARHRLPPRPVETAVGILWIVGCTCMVITLVFSIVDRVGVVLVVAPLTICCFVAAGLLQDRYLS